MKKVKEMNGNEKRAWKEVKNAFNWVVGGFENSVCDGAMDEMPSYEDIVDEIYWTVTNCTTREGYQSMSPCDEVRFAGKEFIMECIEHVMETGDFQYEVKHSDKHDDVAEEDIGETESEKANEEVVVGDKVYWSVVRVKTNIKSQPFVLMKVIAKSKKHAEDVMFATNVAPFQNKVFTEQQIMDADIEWLNRVGIQSKEELTRLLNDAKEGKVTA